MVGMNGGVIVAVCVAAVLALAETLVPRLLCAFVLWRQERARTTRNASAGAKAPVEDVEKVEEAEDVEQVERPEKAEEAPAEAERVWAEACGMKIHSESPDFATDWQYMTLVYKAAGLGHLEAMSKLGDYAFARGDVVEAFYWKHRVEMNGGRCRNPSLMDIIGIWGDVGCPDGGEEVSAGFTEQHAAFAHAVLCLKSGINPQFGNIRLKELADAGDEDAMRFLRKGNR